MRVVGALATRLRLGGARIDLRNHRKLAIVDGRVAYTGSHNVAAASFAPKPGFAPWIDATVRIEGPAARDVQELFVVDWYLDTGETLDDYLAIAPPPSEPGIPVQVIGTGPDSRHEAIVRLIQAAFHLAREELILTTPYFVPDEGTLDAMRTAAERGVRTVLVVPRRNDSRLVGAASRSQYELLLASGVEIHEYTQGLLHAKTITVDRDLALVTTRQPRSAQLRAELRGLAGRLRLRLHQPPALPAAQLPGRLAADRSRRLAQPRAGRARSPRTRPACSRRSSEADHGEGGRGAGAGAGEGT